MKKYKLTDTTVDVDGRILHQIHALKSFGNVTEGELGGYVESEKNLSHLDNSWVGGEAKVYGNAEVYGNARVCGNARVGDEAEIYGDAWVYDDAKIYGNAEICGEAEVCGKAKVYGNAEVCGNAWVYGNAWVCGEAEVYGKARVCGKARVGGKARVCGEAEVYGNAVVYGNAKISSIKDYIVFKNWWSSGRYFTWTRSNNMWKAGCFYGTGEQLVEKAYLDSETSGREYKRIVDYVESIISETSTHENKIN